MTPKMVPGTPPGHWSSFSGAECFNLVCKVHTWASEGSFCKVPKESKNLHNKRSLTEKNM